MTQLTKGSMTPFSPRSRKRGEPINFMFNPGTINVKHSPQFSFQQAPLGKRAYAQFSHFKPVEISFTLVFFSNTAATEEALRRLTSLVDSAPPGDLAASANGIAPLVELQMGRTFNYLGRLPKGVITNCDVTITRQDRTLMPVYASAQLQFKESYIGGYGA